MNTHVLMAVFRRNFVSYFANPTGYVFICLFVFVGGICRLLGAGLLRQQPGQLGPAQLLVPVPDARVYSHDHDGDLGRRAEAGDRRTAADHSRGRFRHRDGQIPCGRGHLQRVVAVLADLQLPGVEQSGQHGHLRSPSCRGWTPACSWERTSAIGWLGWRCWPSA